MRCDVREGVLFVSPQGSLDAGSAPTMEEAVLAAMRREGVVRVVMDARLVSYVSSAGLRSLVRLNKQCSDLSLINVAPEVYEVFETTGLSEVMSISKPLREVSVEGLAQIGAGAFGTVYRLDAERVIKVYGAQRSPFEKIERERRAARQAFMHGVPSAIAFDTVRVGEGYGTIYELIDAKTLGETVSVDPGNLEAWGLRMADLLRQLHETHLGEGQLGDARLILHGWIDVAEQSGLYADDTIAKLRAFVGSIPVRDTFVHGDFHPANIMVMPDGELMLIDMGDASMGDATIDLVGTYHVLRVAARRPGGAMGLTGMPLEQLDRLWGVFVRAYYGVSGNEDVAALERILAFCALPRTMGSTARTKLLDDEARVRQAAALERAFLEGYGNVAWGVGLA